MNGCGQDLRPQMEWAKSKGQALKFCPSRCPDGGSGLANSKAERHVGLTRDHVFRELPRWETGIGTNLIDIYRSAA